MSYLLGIDSGLSVTKAVIFTATGQIEALVRKRITQEIPEPYHIERDMNELWACTAAAIKEVIAKAQIDAKQIAAVSVTAHGDGLYLLDRENQPLGKGVLSLDTRAQVLANDLRASAISDQLLRLSGQLPHASAPATLLLWLQQHRPQIFERIGAVLACKDWISFCLSGVIATDRTEASSSFTNVQSQEYSEEVLRIYGLQHLHSALPKFTDSSSLVGTVTAAAAQMTGLQQGTPVAAGIHDVTASAIGVGGHKLKQATIVAGTYSINEVLCDRPITDPRWFCRSSIREGLWNCMSISPTSATNYDWFVERFCQQELLSGNDLHQQVDHLLANAMHQRDIPLFHPYLYGSPFDGASSASFVGLHGWHNREAMLRAVIEGIALNHRWHIEALLSGLQIEQLHLTGGISRNPRIAQIFADVLGLEVRVAEVEEPAAWGASLCAAKGIGLIDDPLAVALPAQVTRRDYCPSNDAQPYYNERYELFCDTSAQLQPIWERLRAQSNTAER